MEFGLFLLAIPTCDTRVLELLPYDFRNELPEPKRKGDRAEDFGIGLDQRPRVRD